MIRQGTLLRGANGKLVIEYIPPTTQHPGAFVELNVGDIIELEHFGYWITAGISCLETGEQYLVPDTLGIELGIGLPARLVRLD